MIMGLQLWISIVEAIVIDNYINYYWWLQAGLKFKWFKYLRDVLGLKYFSWSLRSSLLFYTKAVNISNTMTIYCISKMNIQALNMPKEIIFTVFTPARIPVN